MCARSFLQKLKQLFGRSDRSGSEPDDGPSPSPETDVTVEREPEQDSESPAAASSAARTEETETEPATGSAESVEKIKGIGPTYRDRLEENGIGTVSELAASDPETVAAVAQTSEGRAAEWIRRAENW